MGRLGSRVAAVLSALLIGAAGPEPALEGKVRAFLERPEQIAAIKTALETQARSTPYLCSELTITPEQVFLKMPPAPRFDARGTMIEGSVRQRFTSSGCKGFQPLFNVWVIAAPGAPTRTVAAYLGTTTAFIDLQDTATPIATVAAGRVLGGCASLDVIDTKEIGYETPGANSGPWREVWLIGGCDLLAQVVLRFLPLPAQRRTQIEVPPDGVRRVNLR